MSEAIVTADGFERNAHAEAIAAYARRIEQQRDDLLAALKHIYEKCNTDSVIEITQEVMDECAAAISKAEPTN